MNIDDVAFIVFTVVMLTCLLLGVRCVIKESDKIEIARLANRKDSIAFCQKLTVPRESNDCLARLALERY